MHKNTSLKRYWNFIRTIFELHQKVLKSRKFMQHFVEVYQKFKCSVGGDRGVPIFHYIDYGDFRDYWRTRIRTYLELYYRRIVAAKT